MVGTPIQFNSLFCCIYHNWKKRAARSFTTLFIMYNENIKHDYYWIVVFIPHEVYLPKKWGQGHRASNSCDIFPLCTCIPKRSRLGRFCIKLSRETDCKLLYQVRSIDSRSHQFGFGLYRPTPLSPYSWLYMHHELRKLSTSFVNTQQKFDKPFLQVQYITIHYRK